ncbi:sensor domain-containing diguanylate cyclase [Neiella sp. HB171785]|uniref:diguanylate cyclase n=1 Tax=Neiella litorisoli TaxID=2771431 RepID=A0A8J6UG10_9GAMM|nr:diguanylate cyclase [Neiella litorisoli]MBD1391379.1 sensor domain-containing diguanylate cyclase [Neiella litorisoli]
MSSSDFREMHWMITMIHHIDVGLVVLDTNYRIEVWNGFMKNHSGLTPDQVRNREIFKVYPDLPEKWFRHKLDSARLLKSRSFTTWEQRPYVFRFQNYRPITGSSSYMYQNMTVVPLQSLTGEVEHIALIIYDVTDEAVNKIEQKLANSRLQEISRTDALTQLYNRGHWEEQLRQEFARMQRSHRPSTLIMLDIDHFKKVNDEYGHPAGDEVIREVARRIKRTKRSTDIAGRYGGEEFAVLLLDTEPDQAMYFAERLRKAVERKAVEFEQHSIKLTISIGISQNSADIDSAQSWIERADEALYTSKRDGRNRVTMSSSKPHMNH